MFRLLSSALLAAALGAQSPLTTTFAHNSASLPNAAVYFDLNVSVPAITLTRMDLNLSGTGVIEIYAKQGSRIGAVTTPAAWTMTSVGFVTSALPGVPTTVHLSPFTLPQGTHGIAIRGLGVQQFFTNGTGGNQHWANAHVALDAGETTMVAFVGPVIGPRVVNASIHYLVGENVAVPPHSSTLVGGSRGYRFTAATDFNIRELALPPQAFQAGCTASYLVRINGAVAYRSIGNAGAVSPGLHVAFGDDVDVIGAWSPAAPGAMTARVSAASPPSHLAMIRGIPHVLDNVGWQWDIGDPNWNTSGSTGWYQPSPGVFGRVLMTTEAGAVHAANTTIGQGCIRRIGSCYESFANGASFDLANSAVTLTPQAGGGYVVSRAGVLLPVGATGLPVTLPMVNDNEVTVPFTLGSFPGWTGVTICANGFVSRASGNGTFWVPSPSAMLNAPEPAFWSWHDFDPAQVGSGQVKIEQSPALTVITWDGVWDWLATSPSGANTVQFQMYPSGKVTIAWGAMSGAGDAHLVGYSPGGASPDPGGTNFSALGSGTIALAAAESFPLLLEPNNLPVVGSTWSLGLWNVPSNAAIGVDVLGLSDPGIDDLAVIGAPGCGLRASLDVLEAWFPAGSSHARTFVIPNAVTLRGLHVHATSAVFVPGMNDFGAITSNGVRGRIGDL